MARNFDDWLEMYLKYSQNSEPPRLYHIWTGLVAIASVLQRKVWLNWGYEDIYPNMYVVLVGPPGGRKGTAMKIAKPFMHDLDISLSSDSLGSIQSLYKELMDATQTAKIGNKIIEHRSLSVWSEELQVFLTDNDPRLIANLTDLYDCPKNWKYTTLKRGHEDVSNCWLNIFGAITPSLLQYRLSQDAVGGGLISRIIFVVGYGRDKRCPITFLSAEEDELRMKLLDDLADIKLLSGPFKPTQKFIEEYTKWYMGTSATAGVNNDKFVGYNNRRALHLRKLCMLLSASQNDQMKLTKKHFDMALYILKHTEAQMPNAFYGIGRGMHSGVLTDVMRYIQDHKSVNFPELLKRFQLDALPNEMETYLSLLEQSGTIKKEISCTDKARWTAVEEKMNDDTECKLKDTLFKHLT